MKRWTLAAAITTVVALSLGCAAIEEQQRAWIFQPSDRSWGGSASEAVGMQWGWLPIGPLIMQRFDSLHKVANLRAPLLVVHGDNDNLINIELGRKLYEAAQGKKRFLLVRGGSHFSTMTVGLSQYRAALADLFTLR